HRLNVDLAMPRSFATRSTLRPLVSVSRTASRLNSFVNRLCLFLLIATSAIFHRGWLSTFAGQVQPNARAFLGAIINLAIDQKRVARIEELARPQTRPAPTRRALIACSLRLDHAIGEIMA